MKDKKARKPKAAKPEVAVERLAFDKYTVVEMNRRDLKSAEYNPRVLGDEEKRRLKGIIRRHGMVSPPTWNKRSVEKGWPEGSDGVVVGGHQRLGQMDLVVVFADYARRTAFLDALKLADNRYQSGDTIMALIAEKQKGPPAEEVPPAGTRREVEKPKAKA